MDTALQDLRYAVRVLANSTRMGQVGHVLGHYNAGLTVKVQWI